MRLISPHSRYSLQIFEGVQDYVTDQTGHTAELQRSKPLLAIFEQGGLLPWEAEKAMTVFNFSGLPDTVNPLTTIGVYDTEAQAEYNGWSKEYLAKVDERLRHLVSKRQADVIIVEKPATPKPWGKYDEMSAEEVISFQADSGFNPEQIRFYESENLKREDVIDAMTAAEQGSTHEAEIVVA